MASKGTLITLMDYCLENRERNSNEGRSQTRRRRSRTVFTSDSIRRMEEVFDVNRYPDIHEREDLASQLGIPEPRIQVWFQNRRSRNKKTVHPDLTQPDSAFNASAKDTTRSLLARSLRRKNNQTKKQIEQSTIQTDSDVYPDNYTQESSVGIVGRDLNQMLYRDWLVMQYHLTSWQRWYPLYQADYQQQPVTDGEARRFNGYQSTTSSGPVSENGSSSEEECIVDRLFRFSKTRRRGDIKTGHQENDAVMRMTVPHIDSTGYQPSYFERSEDRSSDEASPGMAHFEDNLH